MAKQLYQFSYELEKKRRTRIAIIAAMIVAVFVAIELSLAYLIFPVRQISVSMNPDIVSGSYVLVTPLDKTPERGSVVLLTPLREQKLSTLERFVNIVCLFFTAQQYSPYASKNRMGESNILRRVVGLPGDTIYMRDYVAYVQPQGDRHFLTEFELVDEQYTVNIRTPPFGWEQDISVNGSYSQVTLKDGQYFVLGDNRPGALDSRVWGIIDSSRIAASALLIYYPFSHFGKL